MKKYLAEFIGTFFLVLTIFVTVGGGAGAMAPLAIGVMLMVMVYAGGHISGSHYNPAVTLAVFLRGKCAASDVLPYFAAQILGGVLAALAGGFLVGSIAGAPGISAGPAFDFMPGVLAEFLGTFALCYVVLSVATVSSTAGNSFFGLAIGLTVTACAYGLGGVSGGAFNPAVAIGVMFGGLSDWGNIAGFLVGQLAAGALAAFTFKFLNGDD